MRRPAARLRQAVVTVDWSEEERLLGPAELVAAWHLSRPVDQTGDSAW